MATGERSYELLDSGGGRKLEQVGEWVVSRTAPQAHWRPRLDSRAWARAHAIHHRTEKGGGHWETHATIPERWRPWRDARWFTEAVDAGPLPCRPCRQRTCEPGDFRCLTRISAEQVAAAAERALAARNMSSRKAVHA